MKLQIRRFSKSLRKQLDEQDIKYKIQPIRSLQMKVDALNNVENMKIFTYNQIDQAYEELTKQIYNYLKEYSIQMNSSKGPSKLRLKIIECYLAGNLLQREIAEKLDCSFTTVNQYINDYKHTQGIPWHYSKNNM